MVRPEPDDELLASWRAIQRGVAELQRGSARNLESSGVNPQWFAVLHLLLSAEGHRLPMSVIAREMSMTSGGVTKLADRMARQGLIDRRGSSQDRRVVYAALTPEGELAAQHGSESYVDWLRSAVSASSAPDEFSRAARVLGPFGHSPDGGAEADVMDVSVVPAASPRDPSAVERRRPGRRD